MQINCITTAQGLDKAMSIYIELTWEEITLGALEGIMRHVRSIKEGRNGVNQQPAHLAWQVKIEGALAEMAVSKYTGSYWLGATQRGSSDAGTYEVRMTMYENGCLFLHPHDKDNVKYVLVTGLNGKYKIAGWILGKDGKQQKYWKKVSEKRDPAYWVPQSDLHTMNELNS
jgi:hypothetical protein